MHYTTVYDFVGDHPSLYFPLIGLGLMVVGAIMKWGFGKFGAFSYVVMVIGLFVILAAGALPWWDYNRVRHAVANGEAKQVAGVIHDWRVVRLRGTRSANTNHQYNHNEYFSVGAIDFKYEWGSLEAGFANRGSKEDHPTVRLANGMTARVWYVSVGDPKHPPRIVRLDLASGVGADAARRETLP